MVHTGREVFMIPKQAYKQLVLSMLALMIAMSISRFYANFAIYATRYLDE